MSSPAAGPPEVDAARQVQRWDLGELRAWRHHLIAESARALRWRRVLQARLDLAVASAAPVDDLVGGAPGLPDPPDATRLRRLAGNPGGDPVALLLDLDVAQRQLCRYRAAVDRLAEAATRELVDRYAADPTGCLAPVTGRR